MVGVLPFVARERCFALKGGTAINLFVRDLPRWSVADDHLLRIAAFREVRRLADLNGNLTSRDLAAGFRFDGERIPLINPQGGIFKPAQMRFLLSIRTVFPKPGAAVRSDDQRDDGAVPGV
jgi:hypothetical protein